MEQDKQALLRLCSLLRKRQKSELLFNRANYKVSYYRKLLAKLDKSEDAIEARQDRVEIAAKIEKARLVALKRQGEFLRIKKKLNGPINKAAVKAHARVITTTIQIHTGPGYWDKLLRTIFPAEIEAYADEYEATKTLNKMLSSPEEN